MTRTSGSIGGPQIRRNPFAVAPIGDSRAKAVYLDNAFTGKTLSGLSALNWANALTEQRLIIGSTWGVDGDRTDQALARIDAAVASGAGILYILAGVNDLAQGVEGAVSAANVVTMAERGRNAGMTVVIELEVGSNNINTADLLRRLADHNRALRDYADTTAGVYLHDARPAILDPAAAATAVTIRSGYTYDGTHFTARGAYNWGKSLATLLRSLVPPRPSPLLACRAEADVANGRRQLAANPLFVTATGGTLSNGATGSVPASWIAGPGAAGPACAISTEANALGNSVVTDVTFTGADQLARLAQSVDVNTWQEGDVVQLVADVEIVTPGPLASLFAIIQRTVGGVGHDAYDLYTAGTGGVYPYLGPNEPCRFTVMSRPSVIPAGTKTSLSIGIRGLSSGAGNAKWKVHQMALLRRNNAY